MQYYINNHDYIYMDRHTGLSASRLTSLIITQALRPQNITHHIYTYIYTYISTIHFQVITTHLPKCTQHSAMCTLTQVHATHKMCAHLSFFITILCTLTQMHTTPKPGVQWLTSLNVHYIYTWYQSTHQPICTITKGSGSGTLQSPPPYLCIVLSASYTHVHTKFQKSSKR
jgi:hypothetical protein